MTLKPIHLCILHIVIPHLCPSLLRSPWVSSAVSATLVSCSLLFLGRSFSHIVGLACTGVTPVPDVGISPNHSTHARYNGTLSKLTARCIRFFLGASISHKLEYFTWIRGHSVPTWYPLKGPFLQSGSVKGATTRGVRLTRNNGIFLVDCADGIDA